MRDLGLVLPSCLSVRGQDWEIVDLIALSVVVCQERARNHL